MKLDTTIDDKYYESDSILNGRIACDFFEKLTTTIFEKSYKHFKEYKEVTEENWLPIAYGERPAYSTVAAAIDNITLIHQSEYPFSGLYGYHDKIDKNKRIDFVCLHKREKGDPINYYIELKGAFYDLIDSKKDSKNGFKASGKKSIKGLIEQIQTVQKFNPDIHGFNNIYMGLAIICGYYDDTKEECYGKEDVLETVHDMIDKRSYSQLLMNTWMLPEEMNGLRGAQRDNNKPLKFIAIAGIIRSTGKK